MRLRFRLRRKMDGEGGEPMESMMSARQVAELLGVHENWVYDQAVGGDLPSYKLGGTRRFRRDEIDGWIEEHREPGRVGRPEAKVRRSPTRTARRRDPQPRLFE
jgi:excisionase family DNA binding protein